MTLTDLYAPTSIEDIDAELDQFNDQMKDLGYDATVRQGVFGAPIIEVFTDQPEPIETFYGDLDGFLDAFRTYSHKTQDATSSARAALKGVFA